VGRAEHGPAAHAGELERRQGAAGPAREPEAGQAVPLGPAPLEALQHPTLRPLLGVEDLGPELEELGAVAMVEPDPELARVDPACLCGPYGGSLKGGVAGKCLRGTKSTDARKRRKASSEAGLESVRFAGMSALEDRADRGGAREQHRPGDGKDHRGD